MRLLAPLVIGLAAFVGLFACAGEQPKTDTAFNPTYKGIETILLDGDLVNFRVAMTGARDDKDVAAYAACAAAQYALIRGFGFARHVRTNVAIKAGVWRGDAVYTISASLPRGVKTIDAEVTVRDCGAQGIPTV
ncbi:hypothetical protein [Cypionkella sp.]|jgi:hypothetical protein|uniref:hypothetical protein n=1 Tax=Cypionkella sp. TaxID=2811411 RepID=UPI002725093B|nr:hypothetical protein [Cypionkella sp.]MDO8982103.1 hypothetical protein [Cypionkella sp.]MDP2048666.1 hypothetical protein [Cypionkella sp.]